MYLVVFEYDETTNNFGARFIIDYHTQENFDSKRQTNDGTTVIAKGITEDEAQDLVALTPEICRVISTLNSAYEGWSQPSYPRTKWALDNAFAMIQMDRKRIKQRWLTRIDASKYIAHLQKSLESDKHFLAPSKRLLLALTNTTTGQIMTII